VSEIVRTVKLKIALPFDVARQTVVVWTKACNAVSRIAFDAGGLSNAVRLHALAYRAAREGGLSAQVAQSCIRHVASKYAALRSNGVVPTRPCQFREQAVVLQGGKRGRDVSLRSSGLSLWTVSGRCKAVPFSGPPNLQDKLANWAFGDGRLSIHRGQVFLALSFKKEVSEQTAPNDAVIGVVILDLAYKDYSWAALTQSDQAAGYTTADMGQSPLPTEEDATAAPPSARSSATPSDAGNAQPAG